MINKKLFKSAAVITAVMLSVSGCAGGCSKQAEPVIADSAAETPELEESIETKEPTPSPAVEPAEESIDDTVSSESEDNKETEGDTISEEDIQSEEAEPDLGYTITPIDEVTMYAATNCNLRSGPGTEYDIVGSLSYAQEITVNGKVESDGSTWYVIKTDNSDNLQMVSGSLLSTTKPQPQQSTSQPSSGNTNNTSTQQPSGETQQPSGGGQPSSGGNGGLVTDDGAPAWGVGAYTPPGSWDPNAGGLN